MDKTTLNTQLVTAGLKRVFYHLKSVDCERSAVWKSFRCHWKEWATWFCRLLDLSSGVMSRTSFSTFLTASNKFWNTQNLC